MLHCWQGRRQLGIHLFDGFATETPPMTDKYKAAAEAREAALCEPCRGIQRNWRRAPGHAELVQSQNWKEERDGKPVTITRYICDRCGSTWDYENNKANQQAGWSLPRR